MFFFLERATECRMERKRDRGDVEERLCLPAAAGRLLSAGGSPPYTLIQTPSQANSKLQASYHSVRYTVCVVQHSAVCSLCTQYTALSADSKNLPRRPQPLLCGRAANVLHVKEHFHVIHIHRSLSRSCPLGKFALSVVFSVNPLPHCCVFFSVCSSA